MNVKFNINLLTVPIIQFVIRYNWYHNVCLRHLLDFVQRYTWNAALIGKSNNPLSATVLNHQLHNIWFSNAYVNLFCIALLLCHMINFFVTILKVATVITNCFISVNSNTCLCKYTVSFSKKLQHYDFDYLHEVC